MNKPGPNLIRNRLRRLRAKAAKKLPKLVEKSNYKCHWCDRPIIVGRLFTPYLIIKKYRNRIDWENENGEQSTSWFATTDHVIPIREGGGNDDKNLVAACESCNNRRTNAGWHNKLDIPAKWRNSPTCKCGQSKIPSQRYCWQCVEANLEAHRLGKIYWLYKQEGVCKKCNSILVFLQIIEPFGKFFICPNCRKTDRQQEIADNEFLKNK